MKKLTKHITLLLILFALAGGIAFWAFPRSTRPTAVAVGEDVRSRLFQCIRATDWVGVEIAAADCMKVPENQSEGARLRGYAALAQGNVAEAEVHFLRADSLETPQSAGSAPLLPAHVIEDCPVGLLLEADRAARGGNIPGARELVSKALDKAPSLSVARLFRASLDTRANRLDVALGDLAMIGGNDPVRNEARLVGILIHLSRGRNDIAGNELRSLVESSPAQPLALNALGVLLSMEGKWPEAADAFAKAYSVTPQFVAARRNFLLARGAAAAPGSVLALRSEVLDANRLALEAIGQSYGHSVAGARDTAMGDTMQDFSPYAKGAGTLGALTKNPALALGGSLAGDILNRTGETFSQSAAAHAEAAKQADQNWDRANGEIVRYGAMLNPGSSQARAYYETRLECLQIRPQTPTVGSLAGDSGTDSRGGVSAELTEPARTSDGKVVFHPSGAAPQELVIVYPIFVNK